ncbi:hypothetical protein [Roseateles sp. P5_E7]
MTRREGLDGICGDRPNFIHLLRQQSMSAIERFNGLSPQLQELLSKGSFERVRRHIDELEFSDAANVLETGLCIPA